MKEFPVVTDPEVVFGYDCDDWFQSTLKESDSIKDLGKWKSGRMCYDITGDRGMNNIKIRVQRTCDMIQIEAKTGEAPDFYYCELDHVYKSGPAVSFQGNNSSVDEEVKKICGEISDKMREIESLLIKDAEMRAL